MRYNNSDGNEIERFVGAYGDEYELLACTDASRDLYGVVMYVRNIKSNEVSFLLSKNRVVSDTQQLKTVPVLEPTALAFGVEILFDVCNDLKNTYIPIKISKLSVCSDSTISLDWLYNKVYKFQKIERKGTIINNKLDKIVKLCSNFPVQFDHIKGENNPADFVTRCVSGKVLLKTNYLSGPSFSSPSESKPYVVPNPIKSTKPDITHDVNAVAGEHFQSTIVDNTKYSSFFKICRITHYVHKYVSILKTRVNNKFPQLCTNTNCSYKKSTAFVLKQDQMANFPEIFSYFSDPKSITEPQLIKQLNLTLDNQGIIRVKSKFGKLNAREPLRNPILLQKILY